MQLGVCESYRNLVSDHGLQLTFHFTVRFVYKTCGWGKKLTYRVPGEKYAPDSKLIVFDLRQAYEIHQGRMKEAEHISGA